MINLEEDKDTDGVLLIDAANNAFNSIYRGYAEECFKDLIAYIYAYNCYSVHARLFVLRGADLRSKQGIAQVNPTPMALYTIGSLPFLWSLDQEETSTCHVAYAFDIATTST